MTRQTVTNLMTPIGDVLAAMGKSSSIRHFEFFTMETVYLAIQFGVYGILISFIF